ncbi:polymerase II polypeptide D [Saccharata proteae CBS 121410]|uniref:Polymerase II polypeptide D n=1 Tax=Saccharata proteae CBS 121410 TaxID=1314787 RepID=A0A9P4HZD6_9PEZI|nr:polymerase II polypeptide D [Saccharata proteae CBS 121410]
MSTHLNVGPRRPMRRNRAEDEAGAELRLGEFAGVESLSLSEAREVIDAIRDLRKQKNQDLNETETLQKMRSYLDVFSRFKDRETTLQVGSLVGAHTELVHFERSQLATLCCETADEAKTLIPSITDKITDEDLQELLNEISKLRLVDQLKAD